MDERKITCTWNFLFYRENSNHLPASRPACCLTLELPADWTLAEAIAEARKPSDGSIGMPKGSHRSGCFEVQNDRGIWQQVNGKRIDLTTERRRALTVFKTWDQLEAEERLAD